MPFRKFKKKYVTPMKPWDTGLLEEELRLIGQHGLRSKRELRRFKWIISNRRDTARKLLSGGREEDTKRFLSKLYKEGLIGRGSALSEALDLTVGDVLERRLQTIVHKKGLAKTLYQARQLITHGHIAVDGRRVTVPSFIVNRDVEDKITYWRDSPLNSPDHPARRDLQSE